MSLAPRMERQFLSPTWRDSGVSGARHEETILLRAIPILSFKDVGESAAGHAQKTPLEAVPIPYLEGVGDRRCPHQ